MRGPKMLATAGLCAWTALLPAGLHAETAPGVSYETAASPSLVPVEAFLRRNRTLERVHDAASLTNLPVPLRYRARSCGKIDAWYAPEERRITLCYEFVAALQNDLRRYKKSIESIQGFVELTLFHETAHAFFDLLKLPVLGREEDAADQVAAVIMLQLSKPDAVKKLRQVVDLMKSSVSTGKLTIEDVADDHSLTAQRLYNIVCLAYGQDHRAYRKLALDIHMPLWRRRACRTEYRQAAFATRMLIKTHAVDQSNVISQIRSIYRSK
jgi:hypothetical protein